MLPRTKKILCTLMDSGVLKDLPEEDLAFLQAECDLHSEDLHTGSEPRTLFQLCLREAVLGYPLTGWFFEMDDCLNVLLRSAYLDRGAEASGFGRYGKSLNVDKLKENMFRELREDKGLYARGYAAGIAGLAGWHEFRDVIYEILEGAIYRNPVAFGYSEKALISLTLLEDERVHAVAERWMDIKEGSDDESLALLFYLNRYHDRVGDGVLMRFLCRTWGNGSFDSLGGPMNKILPAIPYSIAERASRIGVDPPLLGGRFLPINFAVARLLIASGRPGCVNFSEREIDTDCAAVALAREGLEVGDLSAISVSGGDHRDPSPIIYARYVLDEESLPPLESTGFELFRSGGVDLIMGGLVHQSDPKGWLNRLETILGHSSLYPRELVQSLQMLLTGASPDATNRMLLDYLHRWQPGLGLRYCIVDAIQRMGYPLPEALVPLQKVLACSCIEECVSWLEGCDERQRTSFRADEILKYVGGLFATNWDNYAFATVISLIVDPAGPLRVLPDLFVEAWEGSTEAAVAIAQLCIGMKPDAYPMIRGVTDLVADEHPEDAVVSDPQAALFSLAYGYVEEEALIKVLSCLIREMGSYRDLILLLLLRGSSLGVDAFRSILRKIPVGEIEDSYLLDCVLIASGQARRLDELYAPSRLLESPLTHVRKLFSDWFQTLPGKGADEAGWGACVDILAKDQDPDIAIPALCTQFSNAPDSSSWIFDYLIQVLERSTEYEDAILAALVQCPEPSVAHVLNEKLKGRHNNRTEHSAFLRKIVHDLGDGYACLTAESHDSIQIQFGGTITMDMRLASLNDEGCRDFLLERLHERVDAELVKSSVGKRLLLTPEPEGHSFGISHPVPTEEFWKLAEHLSVRYVDADTRSILCEVGQEGTSEVVSALLEDHPVVWFTAEWV